MYTLLECNEISLITTTARHVEVVVLGLNQTTVEEGLKFELWWSLTTWFLIWLRKTKMVKVWTGNAWQVPHRFRNGDVQFSGQETSQASKRCETTTVLSSDWVDVRYQLTDLERSPSFLHLRPLSRETRQAAAAAAQAGRKPIQSR